VGADSHDSRAHPAIPARLGRLVEEVHAAFEPTQAQRTLCKSTRTADLALEFSGQSVKAAKVPESVVRHGQRALLLAAGLVEHHSAVLVDDDFDDRYFMASSELNLLNTLLFV
jgi:hypothetical protein